MDTMLSLSLDGHRTCYYHLTDTGAKRIRGPKDLPEKVGRASAATLENWMDDVRGTIDLLGVIEPSERRRFTALTYPEYGETMALPLSPGCHVIAGGSSTGKTTLLNQLKQELANAATSHILFLEPEPDALLTETELYDALANSLACMSEIILIDSLRAFVYSASSGATGRGGTNMALFSRITALDVIAKRLGLAIIPTVNFLAADDDTMAFLENAILGSATSSILLPAPGKLRLSSRVLDNRSLKSSGWRLLPSAQRAPVDADSELSSTADLFQSVGCDTLNSIRRG